MDDIEEDSTLMYVSMLENYNFKIVDNELVVSEPIKAHGEETIASHGAEKGEHLRVIDLVVKGKEGNKQAIEDSEDGEGGNIEKGATKEVEEGEQCQAEQAKEDINNGGEIREREQAIDKAHELIKVHDEAIVVENELIKGHDDEMVTVYEGKEKVDYAGGIVGLKCGEDKGKEIKELNGGGEAKDGAIARVDDGVERSRKEEVIEKIEHGGALTNLNEEERSNEEGATESKDDGEKISENGQEMGKGNDKRDTNEGAKENENIVVRRENTNKLRKKGKTKKIALSSTKKNNVTNVDRKKALVKGKETRLVSTSTNKNVAKVNNVDRKRTLVKGEETRLVSTNEDVANVNNVDWKKTLVKGKETRLVSTSTNKDVANVNNVDRKRTFVKSKETRLVSTSTNKDVANVNNVDRNKTLVKGKKTRLGFTSTNKDVAKNMNEGKSSHKKMKTIVEEACIEVEEVRKNVDEEKSLGEKRKRLDKKDAKSAKKGESSLKKKTKVDTMGMIFMCSSKTKKDCYQYKVFGLPANKKDRVLKVYEGMMLFLFDYDLKLLYGIYKAAAPGGFNIEPNAFNSTFPSQVRFTVLKDCLPLAEENFKKIIKDNYYSKNKFNCQLTPNQVNNLCKLFQDVSEGPKQTVNGSRSKHIDNGPKFRQIDRNPRARISIDDDRRRRKDREHERHLASVHEHSLKDKKRKDREQERCRTSFADHPRKDRKLNDREQDTRQTSLHYSYPAVNTPLPQLLPPPHGYDRTFETEIYRERRPIDLPLRRQDEIQRIDPLLPHHERQAVVAMSRRDEIQRLDPLLPHHERRAVDLELRSRDEIECQGAYNSYRELPLYSVCDPLYSSDAQPEYYCLARPISPVEYHLSNSLPTEYRSRRPYEWR